MNMTNQRQPRTPHFGPMPRKSAGSRKYNILKKSRKDLWKTQLHMQPTNRKEDQRGNLGSRPAKSYRKEGKKIISSSNMIMSDFAPSAKSASKPDLLAVSSKDMKKTSFLSSKDCLISSEKQNTLLRSMDDSNAIVGCQRQSQTLKTKEGMVQWSNGIENSQPTRFKAMTRLVHKEYTVNRLNQYNNNTLPSRLKGRTNPNQGEVAVGKKDNIKIFEFLMGKELSFVSKRSNNHKQEGSVKTKEAPISTSLLNGNQLLSDLRRNSGNKSSRMFGRDLSNCQRDIASRMKDNNCAVLSYKNVDQREFIETNSELCNRERLASSDGKTNNGEPKRKREPLLEGKANTNDKNQIEGVVQLDNLTCRPMKKLRRGIVPIEDKNEEAKDVGGDQNCMTVEDDMTRSTSQATILKDCQTKVPMPLCVEQQCYCCSKPIDEPCWSGIFKIDGKEYVSLAGHLSTKSGEKVWKLSTSLQRVVEVSKLSRSEAWPKGWETSKPNGNNIGLYFLPHKIRPDEEFDQLVKEVTENDLVLRAIICEAEMLIFSSILLPQQYQTFQTKHYLWGVFKPREDKGVVVAEPINATMRCAQEVEKEAQRASNPQDEEPGQETISKSSIPSENQWFPTPTKSTQEVDASSVQAPPNMGLEPNAPEEGRHEDTLNRVVRVADQVTLTANDAATLPANHVQTSMGHPPGKIFGFVVRQTPRLAQLIREMEREGAVLLAMHGETIGAGSWPGNMATGGMGRA